MPVVGGCWGFGGTAVYYFFSTSGFCVIVSLFPNKLLWGCCWPALPVTKRLGFCSPEVCCPNNVPIPPAFILGNNEGFYYFLVVPDGWTLLLVTLFVVGLTSPNNPLVCSVSLGNAFSEGRFNVIWLKFIPPCGGNVAGFCWVLSANNVFSPNGWVIFFSYTLGSDNNCCCYYNFFF